MNPRESHRPAQFADLNRLLDTVAASNRFYREKLASLHSGSWAIKDGAGLKQLPFTTKQELTADQTAFPPYGTNLTAPLSQYTRCHQTSGTSGTPLRWLDTPRNWGALVEGWTEVFRAAGVTADDRILFAFSFGPFLGFWLAFEAGQEIGALALPGGGLNTSARLRLLLDQQATVLCCTPTYALHLAEIARAEKTSLLASKIRLVVVAGEPGGSLPATRARISADWNGARVFDHHGMTEVGPVTFECPATPGRLHLLDDAFIAEIVDPATGNESGDTPGELILTTLRRVDSPLIRYRTGDLVRRARFAGACACGRHGLALEGGILGRIDDMRIIRGVNVYPSAIDDLVRRNGSIGEYRVRALGEGALLGLRIEIEDHGCDQAAAAWLEREIQHTLSLRVPVSAVPSGTLPRFEMKARRWVDGPGT